MPHISLNGINLYYESPGHGNPLMLIAGLASDFQSWLPVTVSLSRHYRLILPDNRGAGRTKPMDVETSISRMADDLATLIEKLSIKRTHVLGTMLKISY